jgi:hypothetical protein
MVVIRLSKVEVKPSTTGNNYVSLVDANGNKYSVWADPKNPRLFDDAKSFAPGSLVSIDFVQNGKYKNIKAISPAQVDSREVVVPSLDELKNGKPATVPFFNDRKDRRISRLACINASIEFHKLNRVDSDISEEMILTTAGKFEDWTYRGMEE